MRFDLHPFSSVEAARDWARTEIDIAAGAARARFITVAPGQDMAYRAKYDEARAFLAGSGGLEPGAYPWIEAEAMRAGATMREAAARIKARGDAWSLVQGPGIEALRVAGKDGLAVLADIGQIVAAARLAVSRLRQFSGDGKERQE